MGFRKKLEKAGIAAALTSMQSASDGMKSQFIAGMRGVKKSP